MNNQENKLQIFLTSPKGLTIMVVCVAVLLAIYMLVSTSTKNIEQTAVNPTTSPAAPGGSKSTAAYPTTNPELITTDIYFLKNTDANTVYVNVNTKKLPISGIQLALAYNPSLLPTISIAPGGFFDNPTVLQNSIDTRNGVIYYTLSINPNSAQIYGEGTVAIIHYNGIPTGVSTTLSVLPQTKVTAKGINDSVLSKVSSITIP